MLKCRCALNMISVLLVMIVLLTGCSHGSIPAGDKNGTVSNTTVKASTKKESPPSLPAVKLTGTPVPPAAGTRVSNTGTITTGTATELTKDNISTSGTQLTLQTSGNPLNGMVLTVPAGAYTNIRTYKVSSATITKNTFKNVNPITPLITIDNGGTYAAQPMRVKIPVNIPAGNFAMGFFYDAKTGKLEGMPLMAEDANSITVETMHFSSFFISMTDAALLKADIDSGFRPGIDDWQFTNYGSYIAPGGHCAGQTLTELWYYVTQPDGKDLTLYNRYDKNGAKPATPDIWEDDSNGFRLASVIQKDINWDNFETKFFMNLTGADPELTWRAFAYAIRVTGEPQFVGIISNAGGGHAMIVYRIKDGNLYIADPNYPGNNDRRIEYVNKAFKPYNSGANAQEIAAGNGKAYEKIGYVAKSAFFDWNNITARWQEFKAGTVGNGIFPNYKVVYVNEKGQRVELKDGTVVNDKMLELETEASGATDNSWTVYRDGVELKQANWKYELKPGENLLGIAVWGEINNKDKYIDFTYRKVVYQADGIVSISPAEWTGDEMQTQAFTVSNSKPPVKTYYEWFLDGKSSSSGTEKTRTYSWPTAGNYTLTVKEFDAGVTPYRLTGTATAQITIKSKTVNHLADLQKILGLKVTISVPQTYQITQGTNISSSTSDNQLTVMVYEPGTNSAMTIKWNGTSFSGKNVFGEEKPGSIYRLDEISGSVSPDGATLLEMTYKYRYASSSTSTNKGSVSTQVIKMKNVPLWTTENAGHVENGSGIQKYITSIERVSQDFDGSTMTRESKLTSLDWNGKNARIYVLFQPYKMT